MSTSDDDGVELSRVHRSVAALRISLQRTRSLSSAEHDHATLVDFVDGLLTHVERQSQALQDMRSDLGHKQGIVTRIGGGAFVASGTAEPLREFAASANGDRWFLGRDEASQIAHVVHRANIPSGGAVTRIELDAFLNRKPRPPEVLDLLRLVGSLVD